ncbi:MAG: N-acetyltransferase [candidate division Zixibacteria bacterium]|nr:N-acetyltransferase [candidate division Zixibacteria bacterium]
MSDQKKYFVHPKAIVESTDIGEDTRVWAFCNVQKKARIGAGCNICDHCFVENNVIIGNRVTVKNGVSLWDGVVVEDNVFIGPHAVFTNDVYPRSKVYHDEFDKTLICEGATIGANATVIAGHTIGRYAFVGAGAVVTCGIPDFTLWYGNPARLAGYVCRCAGRLHFTPETSQGSDSRAVCACGLAYRLRQGRVVPE